MSRLNSPGCCFIFVCLHRYVSPFFLDFLHLPPSPRILSPVEPWAQTHFSLSLFFFFMNNDIISQNCWRGKVLRALSGFDNTCLPHLSFSLTFSLSLWTIFGCSCMIFSKTVVGGHWGLVMGFLWVSLYRSIAGAMQEKEQDEESSALSFPLCLYLLTPLLFTLTLSPQNSSWLSHCLAIPLPFCLFYFITHSPPLVPLSFSLSLPLPLLGFVGAEWK